MSILGLLVVAWLTQLAIGNPAGPSSNEEDFRCETYFSNTNTKNLDIGDDDLRQCRINPHRFITQYQGRNQDTINIVVEPIDEPIRFRHQPTLSFGDYFPNEEKSKSARYYLEDTDVVIDTGFNASITFTSDTIQAHDGTFNANLINRNHTDMEGKFTTVNWDSVILHHVVKFSIRDNQLSMSDGHGILGNDFFIALGKSCLDFTNELIRDTCTNQPDSGLTYKTHLYLKDGKPYISVTVEGRRMLALLDTGAGFNQLHSSLCQTRYPFYFNDAFNNEISFRGTGLHFNFKIENSKPMENSLLCLNTKDKAHDTLILGSNFFSTIDFIEFDYSNNIAKIRMLE